ncbi:MAG: tRNA (adenosine(37)-N6)-threonylcarbamoyltransferase complex ATPase subunit type 1 TsaE [Anaerolineae bacterium]
MTPILTTHILDFVSHSTEQTRRIGERLGRLLQGGDLVCLEGTLGTGKTCLVQGIGRGLGIAFAIASPTFIMVSEYRVPNRKHKFYHIDLYRIETIAEARTLGLEDYLYGDDICVIEWAERVREILPEERLWITLQYLGDTKRGLLFKPQGKHYEELLQRFRQEAFRGQ